MTPFARFNIVGVAGFVVQLGALVALDALRVPLVTATCVAVEAAIVHNFFWHERWTWRGLPSAGRGVRFVRFHAANGLISIAGNAAVTAALASNGVPVAGAGLIAALACALINFAAAHAWVFGGRVPTSSVPTPLRHSTLDSAARPGRTGLPSPLTDDPAQRKASVPRRGMLARGSACGHASCTSVDRMKWMFVVGIVVLVVVGLWLVPQNRNDAETWAGGGAVTGSTASTPQHDMATAPNPIGTSGAHAGAAEDHGGDMVTELETITGTNNGMELVGHRVDLHVDVQKRANDGAFWVGSPDNRVLVVLARDSRNGAERQRGTSSAHRVIPVREGQRATISGVIRQVPDAEQRYSWKLTSDEERELADRKIYIKAESVMSEGHGTD